MHHPTSADGRDGTTVLYSGITGTRGSLLWLAFGLITLEAVVYTGGRARCPLTALATSLGDARATTT